MRIRTAVLLPLLALTLHAQQPAGSASATASATLKPSLDRLSSLLQVINIDKWKIPGALKNETMDDIDSIHKDLTGTLPALLTAADAAPGSASKALPVLRNVDALYDVALRITATARISAPSEQANALQSAITDLRDARTQFGDNTQAVTTLTEKRVSDLQASLQARPAVCPTPAPPPPPPAPAKKPVHQKKPATPAAAPVNK